MGDLHRFTIGKYQQKSCKVTCHCWKQSLYSARIIRQNNPARFYVMQRNSEMVEQAVIVVGRRETLEKGCKCHYSYGNKEQF